MMKSSLVAVVLVFLALFSQAQPKLGLKFSPQFVNSRPLLTSDTLDIEGSGSTFKFSIGLIVDHSLTDTYFLSTGIVFMPKHVSIDIAGENGGSYVNDTESYQVNYLQLPITLKLFTNEIAQDISIYFQVGGTLEFKIFDNPDEEEYTLLSEFNPLDASALLGVGGEYKVGINTILFTGVSYQHGLISVVKETTPNLGDEFSLRTGVISIDLGIKF